MGKRKRRSKYEKENSIFLYLKDRPSIFIALVTAFVTIMSFILNMLIYVQKCIVLNYWGFDSSSVSINTSDELYILVITCICFFVNSIMQEFMLNSVSTFLTNNKAVLFTKVLIKEISKQDRKSRKDIKQLEQEILSTEAEIKDIVDKCSLKDCSCNSLLENSLKLKSRLDLIKENQLDLEKIYKQLKLVRKYSRLIIARKIIPSICLCYGILFFVFLFTFGIFMAGKGTLLTIGFPAIISLIITVYPFVFSMRFLVEKRKYKIMLKSNPEKLNDLVEEVQKTMDIEYPIDKIINLKYRKAFSNKNIVAITWRFLILFIAFTISFTYMANLETMRKKEFPILKLEQKHYAIIYENDYLYLNEVEVEDDILKIYKDKHRVVNCEDWMFENMEFDTIQIID